MREYNPDKWVIIELSKGEKTIRKILGGWYGGFTTGDSWRMSSGVKSVEEEGNFYIFHNYSGSVYKCHKGNEGFSSLTSSMYAGWEDEVAEKGDMTIKVIPCSTL